MSNRNNIRRVSGRQLDVLWEFLSSHRDIAVAYNRSLQAKEYSRRKWIECANILNSQGGGVHKDWKGWCKYWVDYKAKLKKRASAVRSSQRRTGGGPSTEPPLTDIENKFLQILGEDYGQGLAGVSVEPFEQPSGSAAAAVEDSPSILIAHPIQEALIQVARSPQPSPPLPPLPATPPASTPPASTPPPPSPPPAAAARSPRRRRQRREPPMSQEAARRALVRSSQQRADAATRSVLALESIGLGLPLINNALQNIDATLQRIESTISGAFPRAAE